MNTVKFISQTKRAFTLIELLVVIAIIAILAAILFPVFSRARENARRASCLSNVKQIDLGIMQYTQDYDEYLPMGYQGSLRWYNLINPYTKSTQLLKCPSDPKAASGNSYGLSLNFFNQAGLHIATIPTPASTSFVCDAAQLKGGAGGLTGSSALDSDPMSWNEIYETTTDWQWLPPRSSDNTVPYYTNASTASVGDLRRRPVPRHFDGLTVGYADGHAKWSRIDRFFGPLPNGWAYGTENNSWDNK